MGNGIVLERLRTILAQVIGTARVPQDVGRDLSLGEGGLWTLGTLADVIRRRSR